MAIDELDTLPVVVVTDIQLLKQRQEETRQAALNYQATLQDRRFKWFLFQVCCLLLILFVALTAFVLWIGPPDAVQLPGFITVPTPTVTEYPCAHFTLVQGQGSYEGSYDYTCK
jgi:hypothetical protein